MTSRFCLGASSWNRLVGLIETTKGYARPWRTVQVDNGQTTYLIQMAMSKQIYTSAGQAQELLSDCPFNLHPAAYLVVGGRSQSETLKGAQSPKCIAWPHMAPRRVLLFEKYHLVPPQFMGKGRSAAYTSFR